MPQKIIIVRHGETAYNVERRLQGWLDIPLNEAGLAQARAVGERLKNENPIAIYSSDHKRAYVTAESIASHHRLIPIAIKELREDFLGVFEGWQWEIEKDEEKEKLWAIRHEARLRGDLHFEIAGTESLYSHLSRVKSIFSVIENKHRDGTVIVVSHGGTINRIMEHFEFKSIGGDYISYKNTSVSVIIREGNKYKLELDNDISHLNDKQEVKNVSTRG